MDPTIPVAPAPANQDAPPAAREPVPPQVVAPPASTLRGTTADHKGSWPRQSWIGFWWWVLMPLDCIDLKTGLPDHDRMASTGIGVIFAVKALLMHDWPPTLLATAGFAAIFGPRMFKLFLVRGAWQGNSSESVSVSVATSTSRVITEERKAAGGEFQPTP